LYNTAAQFSITPLQVEPQECYISAVRIHWIWRLLSSSAVYKRSFS